MSSFLYFLIVRSFYVLKVSWKGIINSFHLQTTYVPLKYAFFLLHAAYYGLDRVSTKLEYNIKENSFL